MEDIVTGLFLRLCTQEDGLDLLTILCAEYMRQDARRNECSTPFAQSVPSWSGYYLQCSVVEDEEEALHQPLFTPVMALQLLKAQFEQEMLEPCALRMLWTFLRALILILFKYDTRMRRLLLCSPSPFWCAPPPERAAIFLRPDGPFEHEVNGFLAMHPQTQSAKDAHTMAYDFVMRADALWLKTPFVHEKYSFNKLGKEYHLLHASTFAHGNH